MLALVLVDPIVVYDTYMLKREMQLEHENDANTRRETKLYVQIPEALVKVQGIADDELVGNFKAAVCRITNSFRVFFNDHKYFSINS